MGASSESQPSGPQQNASLPPGYYYVDYQGTTQGPFSVAQLASWKAELPAGLQVWHTDGLVSACFTLESLLVATLAPANKGSRDSEAEHPLGLRRSESEENLSYSEAALAALPEDDDARQLARLAAERGTTLQELVRFCHNSSKAKDPEESDQPDVGPAEAPLEEQHRYPPRNWRQAKKRKQLRKQRTRTAWLYS